MTNPFASFNFAGTAATATATAATAATPTHSPNQYGKELVAKHLATASAIDGTPRAEELGKVLMFLDRSYGSSTLMSYAKIHDGVGNADLAGRVVLSLPEDTFFGTNPGFFELRLSWPEIDNTGIPVAKVSLNYRIGADGKNVLLSPGGGTGESTGWTNINSARLPIQELIEAGFIAPEAISEVMSFVSSNLGASSAILRLTPKSDVTIVLRNTIVPKTTSANVGRNIVPGGGKQAGDDAGLGMAMVHFQGATLLPRISGLLVDGETKAAMTTKVSMAELLARYGGASRPNAGHSTVHLEPAQPTSSLQDFM